MKTKLMKLSTALFVVMTAVSSADEKFVVSVDGKKDRARLEFLYDAIARKINWQRESIYNAALRQYERDKKWMAAKIKDQEGRMLRFNEGDEYINVETVLSSESFVGSFWAAQDGRVALRRGKFVLTEETTDELTSGDHYTNNTFNWFRKKGEFHTDWRGKYPVYVQEVWAFWSDGPEKPEMWETFDKKEFLWRIQFGEKYSTIINGESWEVVWK